MVRGLSFEEVFVGAGKAQLTNIQNLPKCGFRTSDKPSFVADTSSKTGKSQRAIEKERAKERQGYSSRGNISTAGKRQRKIFHSL